MKELLHAACGPATIESLSWLRGPPNKDNPHGPPLFEGWNETRLDIDSQYGADIVGDMRDFSTWRHTSKLGPWVWKASFDGIFCSHALEHLHLYDAPKALATFRSVLKPAGSLFIVVPNFEAACRHVIEGQGSKLYDSPAGPIFAHEVIYGKENWTLDNAFQRHLTGYTPDLIRGLFVGAGFTITNLSVDPLNILIVGVPA